MKLILTTLLSLSIVSSAVYSNEYTFRKYDHVKDFYSKITEIAIEVSNKHKLPAAAVLAIAGLESGYGSGYVAQITGNILSLGAFKRDHELPILYLPYSKSKKTVLFDPKDIKKSSINDLVWKNRPRSYKRDYRKDPYAGTKNNLELLKYNSKLQAEAHTACLNDFATRWIVKKSNIKVFKDSRIWLNETIKNDSKILFSMRANIGFVDKIGGVPNSFNYRKSWPKKVKLIMKKVGLVQLVDDINNKKMSFNEAWRNNE